MEDRQFSTSYSQVSRVLRPSIISIYDSPGIIFAARDIPVPSEL